MTDYKVRLYTYLTANKKLKLTAVDIARVWKRKVVDVEKAVKALVKTGTVEITNKGYIRVA